MTPDRTAASRQSARVGGWALAAVLAAVALVLYTVRYALVPFVLAAAIGFVADPPIALLQRRLRSPRWLAAIGLYIGLLAVLGAFGYWLGSRAAADLLQLAAQAPKISRNFAAELIGSRIDLLGRSYTPDQLVQALGSAITGLSGPGGIAHAAGSTLFAFFSAALFVVLVPYFMISGPRLLAGAIWLLPPERRRSVETLLAKLAPVLRRYLVGLALVVCYAASIAWVGFALIFHLSHALLLAITVGLFEIIPFIGPLASASIVGVAALQQGNIWAAVLLMAFVVGLRLSIDNIVGPLVLGHAARLHPVVVIMAFVCGAMLFGLVGLLLAVPAAVCVKTTLKHYYAERSGDAA